MSPSTPTPTTITAKSLNCCDDSTSENTSNDNGESLKQLEKNQSSTTLLKGSVCTTHFDGNNDVIPDEKMQCCDHKSSSDDSLMHEDVEGRKQVPRVVLSTATTNDNPSAPSDEVSRETTGSPSQPNDIDPYETVPSHYNDLESFDVMINVDHREHRMHVQNNTARNSNDISRESTISEHDNLNPSQMEAFERDHWTQEDFPPDRSSARNTIIHPHFHGHIHQMQGRHARFIIVIMGFVTLMGIASFVIATTFQTDVGSVKSLQRGTDVQNDEPLTTSPSLMPSVVPSFIPSLSPSTMFHPYVHDALQHMTAQNNNLAIVEGSNSWDARAWLLRHDPIMMQLDTNQESAILEKRILQRFALSVLYFSMNERNSLQVDWMDIQECESIHISCNEDGFVRSLGLVDCQAYGTIPEEIILLQDLENLIISNNPGLKGTIPSSIGTLKKLHQVGIYNNSIEGELPTGLFQLQYLTYLNLSNNQINGKLQPLTMLPRLEKLALDYNRLTGSLSMLDLGQVPSLKVLSLSQNKVDGTIPSSIINMKHLETVEHIYLDGNDLDGTLPPEWSVMNHLKSLALRDNHFSGNLPSEWGNMSSLTYFTVGNNMLSGTVPTTFGHLKNLKVVDIGGNDLNGILESSTIFNWTHATHIYMQSNFFHGSIVEEFSHLNDLQSLFLFDNNFSGTIASSICNRTLESLLNLWVDCDSNHVNVVPKVECDCCTACFS